MSFHILFVIIFQQTIYHILLSVESGYTGSLHFYHSLSLTVHILTSANLLVYFLEDCQCDINMLKTRAIPTVCVCEAGRDLGIADIFLSWRRRKEMRLQLAML